MANVKKNKKSRSEKIETIREGFNLADIWSELKEFKSEILDNEDICDDYGIPYFINFRNEALQFVTGGIPAGKYVEISGDSQTGKSYLLYMLMAEVQAQGGFVYLCDAERASANAVMKNCGIKFDGTLYRSYQRDIPTVFAEMRKFILTIRKKEKEMKLKKAPILLGIDSSPSLQIKTTMDDYEGGKEIKGYAAQLKHMKYQEYLEKFIEDIGKYDASFIELNQITVDKSIMFGDNVKSKGENARKFWATLRIMGRFSKKLVKEIDMGKGVKPHKIQMGNKVVWTVLKNRNIVPYQKATTYTLFDKGLDRYKGFEENLLMCERITLGVTKTKKDGSSSRKEITTYIHKESGEEFYSIKELLKTYPDLRKPLRVGEVSSSIDELVEDNENEMEVEKGELDE